jgi:hypothetical protein
LRQCWRRGTATASGPLRRPGRRKSLSSAATITTARARFIFRANFAQVAMLVERRPVLPVSALSFGVRSIRYARPAKQAFLSGYRG